MSKSAFDELKTESTKTTKTMRVKPMTSYQIHVLTEALGTRIARSVAATMDASGCPITTLPTGTQDTIGAAVMALTTKINEVIECYYENHV